MLNNLLSGLEEVYVKREIIPKMWDRTSKFYKENVWPDLIDIGEKIHHTKKTHSRARAIGMIFFPRTIREFKSFENDMDEIIDKFEAENPPLQETPEDELSNEIEQKLTDAPIIVPQESIANNLFEIKEKNYPYKRVSKNANSINGSNT